MDFSLGAFLTELPKASLQWSSILDPKTNENVALSQLKKNISKLAENSNSNVLNAAANAILEKLFQVAEKKLKIQKCSVKDLRTFILQRRINNNDLHLALKELTSQKLPVNVSVPNKVSQNIATDIRTKRDQLSLVFHPHDADHLESIIKTLLQYNMSEEELYQLVNLILKEKPLLNTGKGLGKMPRNSININDLKHYLDKLRNQENQRNAMKKIEKKRYNWMQARDDLKFSNSELLFPKEKRRRGFVQRMIQRYSTPLGVSEAIAHTRLSNGEPKDFMIFNIGDHSKTVNSVRINDSIFNVNYQDLYGVINSSILPPDETLSIINDLATENWKLACGYLLR